MSSDDCLVASELKPRLVRGYVAIACAVVGVSVAFALTFFYMHHHDLEGHLADGMVIVVFLVLLMLLFAVGLMSAIRLAVRFVRMHEELHKLTDDIAHDLRTPLTRMAAAAELAASGDQPQIDLAETVGTETAAMLHLVNTMLDISRTGQGINRLPKEEVDMVKLAMSVLDLYLPMMEDRHQQLKTNFPDGRVPFVGHDMKLRQLMQNLVDNAVKFTPDGGVITVDIFEDGKDVVFSVLDNGCGVSEKDAPHLFERFYRADASRELPGNGLGLSLVKAIVEYYGGTVSYSDCHYLGSGSRFTVQLPKNR